MKSFVALKLMFLISCFSCSSHNQETSKNASEVAHKVLKDFEDLDRSKYLDLGFDYYFFQGYKNYIEAIDPQFIFDGIMQSNQSKMVLTFKQDFIYIHFGMNYDKENLKIQKSIEAFNEGLKVAEGYLIYLKSTGLKKNDFIKAVEDIRSNIRKNYTQKSRITSQTSLPPSVDMVINSIDYSIEEISKLNDIHSRHTSLPKNIKGEYWRIANKNFGKDNKVDLIEYFRDCYLFMIKHKRVYYRGQDKEVLNHCHKGLINKNTSYNDQVSLMRKVQEVFRKGKMRL